MNISSFQPLNTKYMRIAYAAIIASILLLAVLSPPLLIAASDDDDGGNVITGSSTTFALLPCFTGADPELDCIQDRKVDMDGDGIDDLRITTRQTIVDFLEGGVLVGRAVGVQTIWEDLHTKLATASSYSSFSGTVGDSEPGSMMLMGSLESDRSEAPAFFSFDFTTVVVEGSGIGGLEGICGGGSGHGEGPPFISSSNYEFRFGNACNGNNDDNSS